MLFVRQLVVLQILHAFNKDIYFIQTVLWSEYYFTSFEKHMKYILGEP